MSELKGRKCIICDKPLQVIGLDRKNGKTTNQMSYDWKGRKTHKKCYPEYKARLQLAVFLKRQEEKKKIEAEENESK